MEDCYMISVNVCFNQMSTNKVIQTYGKIQFAATLKEYKHLENLTVFGVEDPETLLKYDNQRVLQAVKLIKEKRCVYIKSRTYA